MDPGVCIHCQAAESEKRLIKCPMCHRYTCESCVYRRGGKAFCQVGCADEFFFGGDEDDT